MKNLQNTTLDSLAIAAISSGIAAAPGDLLTGLALVAVGAGLCVLKYRLRG